jgi:signal transduction histidine kinase/CheY-like chemotaxis protein
MVVKTTRSDMKLATDRSPETSVGVLGALRAQLILSLLLPALMLGGIAWHEREQVIAAADHRVETTAAALGEHALKVLETDDLIMGRVLDFVKEMSWDEIGATPKVHDFLVSISAHLSQVDSVFLIDPAGRMVASSRSFPVAPYSVADRDYFTAARNGPNATFVSAPYRGRMTGLITFSLSRPRLTGAGSFDGLVGVTVSPPYFESFYRAVADDRDSATASLIREDGTVLLRYPATGEIPPPVRPDGKMAAIIAAGAQTGLWESTSPTDAEVRLNASRRLPGRPILVRYGIDKSSALDEWRTHLDIYAALAGLMSLILILTTYGALRRVESEQRATARLTAETDRRRQAEDALRQAQKIEALGRLTGGIAHDFNNLLTVISGNLELIEARPDLEESTRRRLGSIRKAAENGAALVRRLLSFSRRQPLQTQLVDFAEWVTGVQDLLEHSLRPDITIKTEVATDLWPLQVDPGQLESALLNLAANARDAMTGPGTLTLRARNAILPTPEEPGLSGDFVEIAVADTGTGMDAETRRRAIEPFFTTKPLDHGTGLGLSQVYGFVRQSGGSVALASAPGLGTTIRLFLPRGVDDGPQDRDLLLVRGVQFTPGPLLLVEDDEDVAKVTGGLLERLGCTVTFAPNASAALKRLEAGERFALMISDIMMPGAMNGLDLARLVRRRWPDLPILLATGYSAAADEAVAEGFAIMSKPLSMRVLTQMFQSRLVQSP